MALNEITRDSVLQAIQEFQTLGQATFLEKYGFGKAKSYVIVHHKEHYDSKAIVGAAHGFARQDLGPLAYTEFNGGEATVAPLLRKLGFEVVSLTKRNPNWTRDELILALDYYLDHPAASHDDELPSVIKLSQDINAIGRLLGHIASDTFRNPNGVSMKLLNFRAHDPAYTQSGRVGLSRGNKLEKILWDEFSNDRERLKSVASNIRGWLAEPDLVIEDAVRAPDEPEVSEAPEGRILTRLHRYRERDKTIVKRKKASFQKINGRLFCEACGFDFSKTYGERGEGFIECHHTRPVSEMGPNSKTSLADLMLLCANCHRMVHVRTPWLSVPELQAILSIKA